VEENQIQATGYLVILHALFSVFRDIGRCLKTSDIKI